MYVYLFWWQSKTPTFGRGQREGRGFKINKQTRCGRDQRSLNQIRCGDSSPHFPSWSGRLLDGYWWVLQSQSLHWKSAAFALCCAVCPPPPLPSSSTVQHSSHTGLSTVAPLRQTAWCPTCRSNVCTLHWGRSWCQRSSSSMSHRGSVGKRQKTSLLNAGWGLALSI